MKTPNFYKGPDPTLIDKILPCNPKWWNDTLKTKFCRSDHHNIIRAASCHLSSLKPYRLYNRSYKHLCEEPYIHDISCAHLHVTDVLDDIDDMAWFHTCLYRNRIAENVPKKSKVVKKKCALYMNLHMNSKPRKAQLSRNIDKFRRLVNVIAMKTGKWEIMYTYSERHSLQAISRNIATSTMSISGVLCHPLWATKSTAMTQYYIGWRWWKYTDVFRVSAIYNNLCVNIATITGINHVSVSASQCHPWLPPVADW